jgi:integrase
VPRKGLRKTIERGIYADSGAFEVRATVGGVLYSKRLPLDSILKELRAARAALVAEGNTATPRAARGTLAADAKLYLSLINHLTSARDRRGHLDAWIALLGHVPRHRVSPADVLRARSTWLSQRKPLAPKTINHRVGTLRNLYRRLDGKKAPTPCDDIDPLPVPRSPIQRVSEQLILAVDAKLQEREQDATKSFDGAKTRARFRVFVSTGKRPCEIMRAQPQDVDLEARVWVPRDAKGGFTPGVYLNDDMVAAWRLFIDANAWGPYNHGNFGRVIRSAGWPKTIRPYQARHTTWITASERGIDWADISAGAGHRDIRTTRRAYVPVLNSRLQTMSERMDGRFGGFPVVPPRGSEKRTEGK